MKKPKLTISKATQPVPLGASGPKKAPSPLMSVAGKKDYKKSGSNQQEPVNVSFGQTGLTGES